MNLPVASALRSPALLLALALVTVSPAKADLNADLAFSAFSNVDVDALSGGAILQSRGGLVYFERGIMTQALYIIDAEPKDVVYKLSHWSPHQHSELNVWFHQVLPAKPTLADFSGMANIPENKSVEYQFEATEKMDANNPTLQLSKSEAQGVAALKGGNAKELYARAWAPILLSRINSFLGGRGGSDTYYVNGKDIRPLTDIKSLLHAETKVYGQFQRFLNQTPVKSSSGAAIKLQPVTLYYDLFDVQGYAALATGAIYQTAVGTGYQSFDVEYFINSGVYATVEMEQLWPITVGGKTKTLVWRGDFVSAPSIAGLGGTERLASRMIMLQDVKQGILAFRSEFK